MNGDSRILDIISPSTYQEYDRPQHVITISVIGLSGPDSIKGSTGVGKSVLCNRLVRPEFENFYIDHITHLSQADFSGSPVINNDHWLYWGEAELDADYSGKTTHIRFIEQTEFIDDETFEPIRSSRQTSDYIKRALRVNLESHDKLMYICRDQLGAESSFETRILPDGKTNIDAFLLVFDVSRLIPGQSEFISNILQSLNKTKRPVFIAATKCDSIKYYLDGLQELQKLIRKKDFKNVNQTIIETSALQNVNISELLKFVAATVDKYKGKIKVLSYDDAVEARTIKLKELRENFINLIAQLLPREEWPRRQNQKQLNCWKMLVKDFGVAAQPAYKYFTAAYGTKEAERIYDEHMNRSKEWWTAKEQREKLPALRNVLLEFFDSNSLIEAKWDDIVYKTKQHPMFDRYFKPVGQSLSRFTQHSQDARIPAELLQTYDAQHMFYELQKEISNKAILDAQIERFISFLAHKEVIIPGRKYSDAKVLVNEIETYEQFLPNGRAEQAYAEFQTFLINEAERNFVELLQERLPIFAAFALLKQKSSNPNLTVDNEFETYFSHALQDDRRFRQMNGLNERRRKLMQRFCNFIIHPLDDYCFAGSFCANKQLSKIIETNYPNYHKFFPVDIVIYGEDYLVDEFITAVYMSLSVDRLFDYDSGLAKISCFKHADPLNSSRIRSLICVVNSLDTVENFMGIKWKAAPGLPPLFINASASDEILLQQHVSQIADKIGGVYISEDNLSCVETSSIQSLTAHFHFDQIQRVLREVCHAQLSGIYSDLRVQISFMCGDVFKPDVVLSMLLDQANHTHSSGNVFTFDQHLPQENLNIRIRVDATAYHSWLLSPVGWPLNAINGHILIYSPLRIASWHHAEMAARMLVAAAGPNIDDQQIVGKSILILAVDDPGNYFSNKNSRLLLTLGNKLAEEIGASFATLSPTSGGVSQMELFVNFFELIFTNDALPDAYYFPTMLAANLLTPQNASSSTSPSTASRNREYTTLKSTGSSVSQESHDSGASINGAFIGAFRTSTGRSITTTDTESKPPASPSSHGSQRSSNNNNRVPGSGHMSRLSMRSNHSTTSDMSSAPLAKPEFVEINSEFYYEAPTADTPSSYGQTDVTAITPTKNEKTTATISKQKRIEKLLPKFGRLILEGGSSPSAGPSTVIFSSNDSSDTPTTGVVEMFVNGTRYVQSHHPSNITNINIPTMERITKLSDNNIPQIRFRVNGTDRNVDDHGNVTVDPTDPSTSPQKTCSSKTAAVSRLTYQFRCHSSESIFLEVESPTEPIPPESPPTPTKGFLRNRRVIRRQGSLREGGNSRRNRSQIRVPRSFLSANIAHKFVASFRQKTSRIQQTSTDDGVEIVSVSRLDSFGNPTKRTGQTNSTSMPQSPNMSKKSSLSKTSSAVSNAFSWLPNRSQKRSQRAKSEGLDQISSSPSPVDTLQSLCDAENTVDGVPLFASKCINFIEQNGGLELEGIYRVPGNQSQVAELEKQFKLNPNIDLKILNMPLHVIATAIKKFFDTLPEPIIPFTLHLPIIQCIENFPTEDRSPSSMTKSSPGSASSFSTAVETLISDEQLRQQYIDRLSRLLKHELPIVNQHVLGFLTAHLKRVAKNSHKTSMDVRNLSKVFGPTLFRPEFNSFEMMASQMSKFELAMFLMLQNNDQIFDSN